MVAPLLTCTPSARRPFNCPCAPLPMVVMTSASDCPVTAATSAATVFAWRMVVWSAKNRDPTSIPARTWSSVMPSAAIAAVCCLTFLARSSVRNPRALSAAFRRALDISSSAAALTASNANLASAAAATPAAAKPNWSAFRLLLTLLILPEAASRALIVALTATLAILDTYLAALIPIMVRFISAPSTVPVVTMVSLGRVPFFLDPRTVSR